MPQPCGSSTAATATAAGTAAAASSAGKTLTIELGPDPETIDPALNSAVDGANYIVFCYDGLLTIDKDNKVQPGIAESYETSSDGLTWTFHLRKDAKWSDGSAITANDFVYSWRRVADPATAAPYGETVLGMKQYQALLDAADAITDDLDKRYEAYAKAEAYLLDNALFVPVQTQGGAVNYRVSRVVPFTRSYAIAGISSYKFKNMRQRIVIAIALACHPKILICDEPTTALDVTIQAQIIRLIKDLQKQYNYTIIFITHDRQCDRRSGD